MENNITDWSSLLILTFVLGMKHGFDADHLATIDGLTRFNARSKPALARYCGSLFSVGHGFVVVLIALSVSTLAQHWIVPEWFGLLGSLISIGFLFVLGFLNIVSVLRADANEVVQPVGLKGRYLGRLRYANHPWSVALVGALFALSFDTMSQAAFFALAATQFGGWQHALFLALMFVLGMLFTDGVNGYWIARLIKRADQVALIASRVMGLVVSGVSFLVAMFGLAKLLSPSIDAWSEGKELLFGFALMAVIAASFLLALWLVRQPSTASQQA